MGPSPGRVRFLLCKIYFLDIFLSVLLVGFLRVAIVLLMLSCFVVILSESWIIAGVFFVFKPIFLRISLVCFILVDLVFCLFNLIYHSLLILPPLGVNLTEIIWNLLR